MEYPLIRMLSKLFDTVLSALQKDGAVKLGDLREALAAVTEKSEWQKHVGIVIQVS